MTRGLKRSSIPDCFYSKHVQNIFSNRCANQSVRGASAFIQKNRRLSAPNKSSINPDALFLRIKSKTHELKIRARNNIRWMPQKRLQRYSKIIGNRIALR